MENGPKLNISQIETQLSFNLTTTRINFDKIKFDEIGFRFCISMGICFRFYFQRYRYSLLIPTMWHSTPYSYVNSGINEFSIFRN